MSIDAGELDQRLTLRHRPRLSPNEVGQNAEPWVELATVWGRARPVRARDVMAADQTQQVLDVVFTIRWRPDVTGGMRVRWRGVEHEILGQPVSVNGVREDLELNCVAGLSAVQ